jgi:hypothetical protein
MEPCSTSPFCPAFLTNSQPPNIPIVFLQYWANSFSLLSVVICVSFVFYLNVDIFWNLLIHLPTSITVNPNIRLDLRTHTCFKPFFILLPQGISHTYISLDSCKDFQWQLFQIPEKVTKDSYWSDDSHSGWAVAVRSLFKLLLVGTAGS